MSSESIVHNPTPGPSGDTERRPIVQGHINHAANNGTTIAFSEKTVFKYIYNYCTIADSSEKVSMPADANPKRGTPNAENSAPGQAVFAFQSTSKTPEMSDKASPTQSRDTDAALLSLSPEMNGYLNFLSRAIQDSKQEGVGSRHPPPIGTSWPVNPPQSESTSGNLTLKEEICMLSPRMQNYLNRLGDNQEGTLVDDLEKFYRVASSSGDSDVALLLGAFAKDLQSLSPGMQQHITGLITNGPNLNIQ